MAELLLTIPAEHWLSANDRYNRWSKAAKTKWLRAYACEVATEANIPRMMQVHVGVFVGYPSRRRADPLNAHDSVKAALDGITDSQTIWVDDDSTHVVAVEFRRDPTPAPKGTHTLRLVITDQALSF